eukprot:CAMPEP_0182859782 /NCGR_PEP_ID=MMETSP0034_2-20130328/4515_1 /TAXON_ID=156128 /ORGANISM="Nephroselmis pyriformis, Strain CCMP717" /LENGTH=70 /DNA_ID=CAMNT_0024991465 /DNA_START=272 /DNA_END=481 /DNA_ORIENTATION=+
MICRVVVLRGQGGPMGTPIMPAHCRSPFTREVKDLKRQMHLREGEGAATNIVVVVVKDEGEVRLPASALP